METSGTASHTKGQKALLVDGDFKANSLKVVDAQFQHMAPTESLAKPATVLMTTDTVGGLWVYAITLAAALRRHNVKLLLAAMGQRLSESQRSQLSALDNVCCFESDYKLEWMENPWNDVRSAGHWLMRLADKYQPDIVHLNNYTHAVLRWSCPVIVVGHSCVYSWHEQVHRERPSASWKRYFCRVSTGLNSADMVIAPTWTFLRKLNETYGKFRSGGAVHNGIAPFSAVGPKEKIIFTAGRIWDEGKNIQILTKVQPLVKWPIFVAGSRHHPDGTRADCGGLKHLDFLEPRKMKQWYNRAAVYVLPALYEPFGLSVLEAANAGCALVLGDIPSLREIWADAAVFVNPRDETQIARAITMLMEDSAIRTDYAERAKARALLYPASKMAHRYNCLYRRLITNQPIYAPVMTATMS